ncbi:MAG: endo alpha-1,4 polygalactosaminidase [Deltaproteobacteria bacterium]|nr:endo alpha-1,4 polygalactosaminidase [Deltaproteobacteria bacterium]
MDAATGDDVGSPDDAGTVADGSQDAETDTGADTGTTDDAAQDAGTDAGVDAGPSWWRPAAGTSWQIQLQGTLSTNVDVEVYDIDLFDTDQSVINKLKADGRKVICYFSAGSYEDWRPDKAKFQKSDYGKPLDNWPGEWWLDVRSQNVRIIMADRMDIAVQKKCDAVDPDNVDGYQNDTGFPLTAADQQDYLEFLADAAHARGLAVGLKNCLGLVTKVVSRFEFQVNEECLAYNECRDLKPFINADKPVFHIEYVNQTSEGPARKAEVCGDPTIAGFSTLIKTWDLDAWRLTCD